MKKAVIQKEIRRIPFLPFTLRMNDDREFYIRHPELISLGAGCVFLIDDMTGRGIYLEPSLIASMQPDEERSSPEQPEEGSP